MGSARLAGALLTVLFAAFAASGQVPSITSVTPAQGTVGFAVMISGTNVSATATNNVVVSAWYGQPPSPCFTHEPSRLRGVGCPRSAQPLQHEHAALGGTFLHSPNSNERCSYLLGLFAGREAFKEPLKP